MKRFFLAIAILPLSLLAQPLGETYVAGTTWYDVQHTGSAGRMIVVDSLQDVHVVWTNYLNDWTRHVFYNKWRHDSAQFESSSGQQVDQSARAGYVTLGLTGSGCPLAAFHVSTGTWPCIWPVNCGTSGLIDNCLFIPEESSFLYPKIAIGRNDVVHLASLDVTHPSYEVNYSRGEFSLEDSTFWVNWTTWDDSPTLSIGPSQTIAQTVTASRQSDRVAVGWTTPTSIFGEQTPYANDIAVALSADQGLTWNEPLNITSFSFVDSLCCDTSADSTSCNRDTLSTYNDLCLHFDRFDILHAAFSTRSFFGICYDVFGDPTSWINQSMLYHWSEATNQFSLIADGYWPWPENLMDCGAWQLYVQRPSLAEDTATGFLYCAYMQYDTNCYSDAYFPMADIYISVSTDGGSRWSVGTNVTRTCPGQNIPPPGSLHERDHSLAEYVSDGVLHLFYCLDHDAGSSVYNEGVTTQNDMLYQRIPVDSIPTTPLIENYPLHWDSTGFYAAADDPRAPLPNELTLRAYPNPFNSTAQIEFTLKRAAKISVTIHDILGREVTTLANKSFTSGTHKLNWNANDLASGIYFVSLKSATTNQTQKLLLLR